MSKQKKNKIRVLLEVVVHHPVVEWQAPQLVGHQAAEQEVVLVPAGAEGGWHSSRPFVGEWKPGWC